MKNKSFIIALVFAVVASLCFSMVAYGGDTPIIPIPGGGGTSSTGSSSSSDSSSDWETPTESLSVSTTVARISITKCTFSTIAAKTYTGKAIKPVPTVKYKGTKLTKDKHFTLKYSANKKVGTATVTVTGKGKYTGTKKLTFKINPKGTTVTKVTSPKKKQLKVTWKKQTTQATGYNLRYSTSSGFKNADTVTVKSNKTTVRTIKKLKSNKKYYVSIRTYKTVNGKKYYSTWSKAKSIKVK